MRQLCTVMALLVGMAAWGQVTDGVSRRLAEERRATVSNVCYQLAFSVPAERVQPVTGHERLTFEWTGRSDLQVDFQGVATALSVNGKSTRIVHRSEHLVIPARRLRRGQNTIEVSFTSLDKALNRSDDYLYTLFVPAHARSVFPCFDQPDLKARFVLEVSVPDGWRVLSNADGATEPLPTYLFSFTAGRFYEQRAVRDGRELTALYRETDAQKVAQLPLIFDQIALSLRWLEAYTGIAYPFSKYGFVILPGYQFGGMEHPGCIQYRDRTLFLEPDPTPDEQLNRLHLLAHETAHMWFGDLVTMRWFDDVWTKEVFANFMADKIAREQFPDASHDLSFLKTHYVPALATDRTDGTHPIQQPLDNLNRAGLLYGNMIYHKAPIMMRQLELRMGERAFRRGLQRYLRQFSYGNATWDDLIAILDAEAPTAAIRDFDRQWVKQRGVATVDVTVADGEPLPNADGMGYARYRLADSAAVARYVSRWPELQTEQARMAAAMMLYENYLMHTAPASLTFRSLYALCASERNELTLSLCATMLGRVMRLSPATQRAGYEQQLWQTAHQHPVSAFRKQLLRMLCQTAVSPALADSVYHTWQQQDNPLLNTRDYMLTAYHLALLRPHEWQTILATQRRRLKGADLQREFDFVSRGCTPDTAVQRQLFESLLQKENRTVEPYAAALLALLNDELREPQSNRYITPALDALEDVQRTGDIFFPTSWCNALLAGHRSDEARRLVRQFIDSHPGYPPTLMNKLKESSFILLNGAGEPRARVYTSE